MKDILLLGAGASTPFYQPKLTTEYLTELIINKNNLLERFSVENIVLATTDQVYNIVSNNNINQRLSKAV